MRLARLLLLIGVVSTIVVPTTAWLPLPLRRHSPTTASLAESLANNNNNNNNNYNSEEEANHLIAAGNYFKGIDENVGTAMCNAGIAWSSDWSQVAEALEEASTAFWDVLSKKNISPKLQTICRSVAQELEDISTIEGCSSVGPAASIPNWITIHQYLDAAAQAYEREDAIEDAREEQIYDILKKTSLEIEALIESI